MTKMNQQQPIESNVDNPVENILHGKEQINRSTQISNELPPLLLSNEIVERAEKIQNDEKSTEIENAIVREEMTIIEKSKITNIAMKNLPIKRKNDEMLAKITSTQQSICVVIDLIL